MRARIVGTAGEGADPCAQQLIVGAGTFGLVKPAGAAESQPRAIRHGGRIQAGIGLGPQSAAVRNAWGSGLTPTPKMRGGIEETRTSRISKPSRITWRIACGLTRQKSGEAWIL